MKSDYPGKTRMISYAQNFEDVILHRVFRDRQDGFYIDVGAMDPVFDSVTKSFYDKGWSGINVEPNEYFYNKLLAERPRDINLNLALGEREETRSLYVFERYGNSTFDESSRDRFVEQGHEAKEEIVRVTTLAAVCRDYVRRQIDFLKIDCEGWEKFVLKGADWDRFRPIVLVIEATAPGSTTPSWSEWEPFLIENAHYEIVYFDGLNRFYLRREYADLRSHFGPPNIFDNFKPHGTEAAERSSQALQQERNGLAGHAAELEDKINAAVELLQAKENELRCTRVSLEKAEQDRDAAEQVIPVLQQERDSLARRVADLEAQVTRDQEHIAELEKQGHELNENLLKTRLWVGQLSQDLAATKEVHKHS